MSKVYITDVTLRDAHQCLIATRLRTADMLPICEVLDHAGFWALEVWGGATYDACLRFLKEDPWERLSLLRQALPQSRLSMLLRGQNLLGYRHYADDVVEAFVTAACEGGIDVFRIFDALNDVRNLETAVAAVKAGGKHAQGTICYTISPVHTIAQFVDMGKQLQRLGCDSIAIKDMAGLLTPNVTEALMKSLLDSCDIPIHLHSHATSGLATACHYKAVEAGCRHIDTAISAFAEGASHPCTESVVAALADTPFDTGLDLSTLQPIADYFRQVRKKYAQFESDASRIDPRVQRYQVPGGMISNLHNQLKEQDALDRLDEVHEEIPKVRKDLGYPPLVTPTSQVVGTQAVINVLSGERYKSITNEVKLYCEGKYGKPPAAIDATLQRQAIGDKSVVTCRPADLLKNEFDLIRQTIGDLADTIGDVLSFAMFPDVGRSFLQERRAGTLQPEPLQPPSSTQPGETKPTTGHYEVGLHGEQYRVSVNGMSHWEDNERTVFVTVDGAPEELLITVLGDARADASRSNNGRPTASTPGDVTVAMPSTVIEVSVKEGDVVSAGDVVLITEAMKMETSVQAPISGTVKAVYCEKSDMVNPKETLVVIG